MGKGGSNMWAPSDGKFSKRDREGEHPGTVVRPEQSTHRRPTHISRKNTLRRGHGPENNLPTFVRMEDGEWRTAVGCAVEGLLMHPSPRNPRPRPGPGPHRQRHPTLPIAPSMVPPPVRIEGIGVPVPQVPGPGNARRSTRSHHRRSTGPRRGERGRRLGSGCEESVKGDGGVHSELVLGAISWRWECMTWHEVSWIYVNFNTGLR